MCCSVCLNERARRCLWKYIQTSQDFRHWVSWKRFRQVQHCYKDCHTFDYWWRLYSCTPRDQLLSQTFLKAVQSMLSKCFSRTTCLEHQNRMYRKVLAILCCTKYKDWKPPSWNLPPMSDDWLCRKVWVLLKVSNKMLVFIKEKLSFLSKILIGMARSLLLLLSCSRQRH